MIALETKIQDLKDMLLEQEFSHIVRVYDLNDDYWIVGEFDDGTQVLYDLIFHYEIKLHDSKNYNVEITDENMGLYFRYLLKRKIRLSGYSRQTFSKVCGVSEQTLSSYMTGKSYPNIITLHKIAKALGCPSSDLFPDWNFFAKRKEGGIDIK